VAQREGLEPGVQITRVVREAVVAAGRLARTAHADEIGRQAATGAGEVRNHVAPEIRRRGVAVQEDDRNADADLHVGHVAVEDGHTPPLVEVRRRDRVRHRAAIIIGHGRTSAAGVPVAGPQNAMARWLVGTSGYVYRDWRRRFYPQALGARAWLPYYAAAFDTVELNSPFYRLPRAATFRAWASS